MDPSAASVQGVPGLFGSVGPSVVGTSVRAPADTSAEATEARRRRLAVAGVSLMGAAAVSTAVFQTVTGTSTTLAMTGGLSAFLGSTSTPTPQGPAAAPVVPAAPAITDLGSFSPTPAPPTSPEVALRAARGPLAGPGDLPDATRSSTTATGGGGGAPASSPGGWSGGAGGAWSSTPGTGTGRPSSGAPSSSSTTVPSAPSTTVPTTTPPKSEPPKSEPPKSEPPKSEPPKSEPPKSEPPKSEPPKSEPPKSEPSSGSDRASGSTSSGGEGSAGS